MGQEKLAREGDIVEFADKGKIQLGVVMACDEKTSKYKVLNASGREGLIAHKQVMHVLAARISPSLPLSNLMNELKSLDMRADKLASQCGVEDLWELVCGEADEVTLDTLVSMNFQSPEGLETLAMIRALRADRVYFKALTPDIFSPRPKNVVEDLIHQAQLKAEKLAWRVRFADEAAAQLRMSPEAREEARESGIFPSPDTREAWKVVEQYAIFGADIQDKTEAEALIECLQSRINRGFSGTAHWRARSLLRETGYWQARTQVPLLKYAIPEFFPAEVEDSALDVYRTNRDETGRLDFTHLCVFSIDDPETLDIDDALSIEKLEGDRMRLGVHIASPASAFPFEGIIEREARHRATSIYLPDRRLPMVPAILSENALSLMQGERRNAVSFMLTFDAQFNIVERDIVPSIVKSSHRLSYDAVEQMIEEGNDFLSDQIRWIQEITEFSAANRHLHGAIDIDLPEFKLVWDAQAQVYKLVEIDGSMMSRMMVSECMILANALCADFCFEHGIPTVYRIQPPPNNMPSAETLEAMPNDLIRAYTMRRCMMPASTSMEPRPHAGLGLERYLQATSPLRRYGDLLVHYQLEHWFLTHEPRFSPETYNGILSETDLGQSHARQASHEVLQIATLEYLKQEGHAELEAIVLQYMSDRNDVAQVCLIQTQVRANVSTKTRLPIGTICRVRIDNVKPEEGVILLQFVEVIS